MPRPRRKMYWVAGLAAAAWLAGGCGRLGYRIVAEPVDAEVPLDAGADAGQDAGADGGDTLDAGTDAGPQLPHHAVAFASSGTIIPASTGSAVADATCQQLATDAGLPGAFIAWYGAGGPVAPRLATTPGWVRTDGLPIVQTLSGLTSGLILRPLSLDENGTDVRGSFVPVATGTFSNGTPDATCSGASPGLVSSGVADSAGNSFFLHARSDCSNAHRLYCFEVGNTRPATATPIAGRLIFLSAGEFTPDAGIAAADALCNAEATLAGRVRPFVALLATSGVAIRDRIRLTSDAWVRPDGVQAATASGFLGGAFDAPPNVTLAGSYVAGATVWTGADGVSSVADITETCGDWLNSGGMGTFGAAQSTLNVFEAAVVPCSEPRRVYCAEMP